MFAFDILLNLIFPPSCVSCDAPLDVLSRNALCGSCSEKFLNEKERKCPLCGKTHSECSCMPARLKKYCSDAMHVSEYSETDGVTRSLVLSAKDRNLKYLYDFIVNELAYLVRSRIGNAEGYIVSYVPRSKRKKAGTLRADLISSLAKNYAYLNVDSSDTVSFLRPFARRAASTLRPLAVAMRARNPCLLIRLRREGW